MCVTVAKVGQGQPKSNDCRSCLTSAKYERSSTSHRRTGTGKPKSRSRRFDLFGQGHLFHLPCETIPSCMTVHDNCCSCNIMHTKPQTPHSHAPSVHDVSNTLYWSLAVIDLISSHTAAKNVHSLYLQVVLLLQCSVYRSH